VFIKDTSKLKNEDQTAWLIEADWVKCKKIKESKQSLGNE